jgi:arginase family enzyme
MLIDFLSPVVSTSEFKKFQLGHALVKYQEQFPDLSGIKVALVGICDARPNENNIDCSHGPQAVRQELYKLSTNRAMNNQFADLGDIKQGETIEDTRKAVEVVCSELLNLEILPVFIGGSKGFIESIYHSYAVNNKNIDLTYIGSNLPLQENELLGRVCAWEPHYLYNLNAIGLQKHFVHPKSFDIMENLGFNHLQLGKLKGNISDAEPIIRNTDLVCFDIGAVSSVFAPANENATVSGLDADMSCQLSWYAGLSDTCRVFGLFEINPLLDQIHRTAQLGGQMVWYFMEGFLNRKNDHPSLHNEFYTYRCNLTNNASDILFFKSKRTNRWWMELPGVNNSKDRFKVIPCTYNDYQSATNGDIPDRYLKALQHIA